MQDIIIIGAGVIGLNIANSLASDYKKITIISDEAKPKASEAAICVSAIKGLNNARKPLFEAKLKGHFLLKKQLIQLRKSFDISYFEGACEKFSNFDEFEFLKNRIYRNVDISKLNIDIEFKDKSSGFFIYPEDYYFNAKQYLQALLELCDQKKIAVVNAQVLKIKISNDSYSLRMNNGEDRKTRHLIIAAGSGSPKFLNDIDFHLSFKLVAGHTLHRINDIKLKQQLQIIGKKAFIVDRDTIFFGSSSFRIDSPNEIESKSMAKLIELKNDVLKITNEPSNDWLVKYGIRLMLKDRLPLVDVLDETTNGKLVIATGYYKNGYQLAPMTGDYVKRLLNDNHLNHLFNNFSKKRLKHP